ncbi:hypothetical protein AB9L18_10355 [Stenotrophomonas lactitubi]|jgi:hypothetical protein|uniref:hypothetical protein n=1 Tax=Stenotrophomonas lactitubi TaxID=2045214 RepID=UPI0035C1925E
MTRAKLVQTPRSSRGYFITTTANTSLSQRASLEETLLNLATALSAEVVETQKNARGAQFYRVEGAGLIVFQSATNTILTLSQILASRTFTVPPLPNDVDK